mmetsp:Transcript_53464/g.165727  ORF Transcript_53464/g.165727 Transcript_53464/m.165727 type:complete len:289 (+) Transcript_53464:60-926(+)
MGRDEQARGGAHTRRRWCAVGLAAALAPQAASGTRIGRAAPAERQALARGAELPGPVASFLSRNASSGSAANGTVPLDTVSLYNIMMCWERLKVADDPCGAWMVERCRSGATGQGYCRKLKDLVTKDCASGKASACDKAVQLGIQNATAIAQASAHSGAAHSGAAHAGEPPAAQSASAPAPAAAAISPAPAPAFAPTGIDKAWDSLPPQGFDEFGKGKIGKDDLGKGSLKDWRSEWPQTDETEAESVARVCKEQPSSHVWCKLYLEDRARRKRKEPESWWSRWFGWLW